MYILDITELPEIGKLDFVVDVLSFCMFPYGFDMKAAVLI